MNEIITDINALKDIAELAELSEDADKNEARDIVSKITEVLLANSEIKALAAPQIGIKKRIFCINFNGTVKAFIDPVVTKKLNQKVIVETCASMPNKEYLVIRPTEISAVYFNEDLKYDDNKFLDAAATIFDQQMHLLDGVLPADIGLESDIVEDGPLSDLSDDEFKEAIEILKKITELRLSGAKKEIEADKVAEAQYNELRFAENVIDNTIQVVDDTPKPKLNREQRRAIAKNNKKRGNK